MPEHGSETFLAGPSSAGLFYTAVPLTQTSYSILSYNVTSGEVASVSTQPKGQMDGLGVCVGFMLDDALYYVFKNDLVRYVPLRYWLCTPEIQWQSRGQWRIPRGTWSGMTSPARR
jgi:hypothetical protein